MKRKTPPDPDREELWDAIKNNNLGKYTPKQIEKGMLQKDLCEENLYHWAAKKRTLQNIPPEFLTKENLLLPNNDGWTCLHLAALWGCLDKIPKELLTKDHLLQESRQGYNCLHFAAWRGHLTQIPPLPHQTLLELKAHFESKHSSKDKDNILDFLHKQLQNIRKAELVKSIQHCDHPNL
jgi:hypothetical protein